jgi:hypothetical protein
MPDLWNYTWEDNTKDVVKGRLTTETWMNWHNPNLRFL